MKAVRLQEGAMNFSQIRDGIFSFVKKNAVMVIAFLLALITMFFVPVDAAYLEYFDF